MRYLFLLLTAIVVSVFSVPSSAQDKPTPVYFYAWGGNPAINDYIRWAAKELQPEGIQLHHVKVADIAEVVKQLVDGQSNADLVWINGENFHALKAADRLRAVVAELDLDTTLNDDLDWRSDFGEPIEGLEVPWGVGQFYLLTCQSCIAGDQVSANELLEYAAQHPGRMTYPKPPEFHGTTFLKSLLLSLSEQDTAFRQPVDAVDAEKLTAPLWTYLDELQPLLWQGGENFPSSAAQQLNWFANQQLDIALSFNPNEVKTLVNQARVPQGTKRVTLGEGAITNSHYLAVPTTSQHAEAAQRVIRFFLSETAQRKKADLSGWGDPTVLDLELADMPPLLPVATEFHASWQSYLEQQWQQRYPR
ncbi:putative thiamine transport system substrate-binding protein [Idiomarina fontislapidosi]|uniref:ABC transporter substrate-binding protein n=1 Tax=Idiomarina fontislapidosi TaxID=263723 RepID=A0A432XYJ4_9GAMM|nr:ABC transporter substrate-binding protein [Idiomarina fontislapidosi]PYE32792.1 putative thiamine transport system substrate-binding protein [Idiomarina fontislapidosi]RUO53767.1 ABC transporter substrate-binding protein [Idiomarina fontislapidosi]